MKLTIRTNNDYFNTSVHCVLTSTECQMKMWKANTHTGTQAPENCVAEKLCVLLTAFQEQTR